MSADFSKAAAAVGQGVIDHADRDGLKGVARAVFIDRGGHAPGETCPIATVDVTDVFVARLQDAEDASATVRGERG